MAERKMVLRDKKVLITGAASGIGLSTARECAQRRAVPILTDINEAGLQRELDSLRAGGYEAFAFKLDITDVDSVRTLAHELDARELVPDVLINCAGLTLIAHVGATTHDDWMSLLDVNLKGTINMVETFLPYLMARGSGHIVNVGSIDGIIPVPGQAAYCATKFAITGLTEVLYFDLKDCGIGVTLVCPGYVDTPMARAMPVRDMPMDFKGSGLLLRVFQTMSNSPNRIARNIVEAVEHNKFLVIPGFPSRLIYHYRRLFPKLATLSGVWTARIFERLRRARGMPARSQGC